ncbi:uncharacterized protein LOC135194639 [Vanessa tameamea]|uniref:Uncharacterized protein LOC135194639 n=1 Tax=Vanessa tameamea TaxID=334116 RepID=A0ABM4AYJ0_VANTA
MALYGAPIWVDALTADNRALLRKPQRVIAVRGIRGGGDPSPLESLGREEEGHTTFRMTQVLTMHGCFGKYLHGIARREVSTSCHECGAPDDTAHHTLSECAAWRPQRHTLAATMGGHLPLPSIVNEMLGSETCWSEMRSFCENVMSQTEAAVREREEDAAADPLHINWFNVFEVVERESLLQYEGGDNKEDPHKDCYDHQTVVCTQL